MPVNLIMPFIAGSLAVKLATALLSLVVYAVYAHLLTPEQFGLLALTLSVGLLLSAVARLGLENLIIRFGAQFNPNDLSRLYTVCICLVFVSSSMLFFLMCLFSKQIVSWLSTAQLQSLLPYLGLYILLNSLQAINAALLNALHKARLSMALSGFVSNVSILLGLLIFKPNSAHSAFIIILLCMLVSLIVSYVFCFYYCLPKLNGILKLPFSNLAIANKHFFVISLSAIFTQQISSILVAKYASLEDVAMLAIAIKVATLFSYPLQAVNAVCAPKYAKLSQMLEIEKIKKIATETRLLLTAIASIGLLVVFLFIEPLLNLLSHDYIGAVIYVKILAVGQWVNLCSGSAVSILLMTGHERLHQYQNLLITCLFLIFLWLTIPFFGALAASVLMTLSLSAKNLISAYYVNKRVFKMKTHDF